MTRERLSRQRGAVAVEFAIILPLLALLVFGAVEMGSAWNDSQTVLTSSRTAARSLAQFGDAPEADRDALLSVEAAFANTNVTAELLDTMSHVGTTLRGDTHDTSISDLTLDTSAARKHPSSSGLVEVANTNVTCGKRVTHRLLRQDTWHRPRPSNIRIV